MIYVVLGMHKSGTTLVARTLHRAGIDMGEDLDPDRSYDAGEKFERESTKAINHEILGSKDVFSLDIVPPARPIALDERLRSAIRHVVADSGGTTRDWGFKDPRTCLTYPVWSEALPDHRRIVVFRRPEAMWPRYRRFRTHPLPKLAYLLVLRWCEHYGRLLEDGALEGRETLVVDYERLMVDDDELRRLGRFVGRDLPDERRPGWNRGRARRSPWLAIGRRLVRRRAGLDADAIAERIAGILRARPGSQSDPGTG